MNPALRERRLVAGDRAGGLFAGERGDEVFHHVCVGVDRRHHVDIGLAPAAQHEPLSVELVRHVHIAQRASTKSAPAVQFDGVSPIT
jgi:hypothetical protein